MSRKKEEEKYTEHVTDERLLQPLIGNVLFHTSYAVTDKGIEENMGKIQPVLTSKIQDIIKNKLSSLTIPITITVSDKIKNDFKKNLKAGGFLPELEKEYVYEAELNATIELEGITHVIPLGVFECAVSHEKFTQKSKVTRISSAKNDLPILNAIISRGDKLTSAEKNAVTAYILEQAVKARKKNAAAKPEVLNSGNYLELISLANALKVTHEAKVELLKKIQGIAKLEKDSQKEIEILITATKKLGLDKSTDDIQLAPLKELLDDAKLAVFKQIREKADKDLTRTPGFLRGRNEFGLPEYAIRLATQANQLNLSQKVKDALFQNILDKLEKDTELNQAQRDKSLGLLAFSLDVDIKHKWEILDKFCEGNALYAPTLTQEQYQKIKDYAFGLDIKLDGYNYHRKIFGVVTKTIHGTQGKPLVISGEEFVRLLKVERLENFEHVKITGSLDFQGRLTEEELKKVKLNYIDFTEATITNDDTLKKLSQFSPHSQNVAVSVEQISKLIDASSAKTKGARKMTEAEIPPQLLPMLSGFHVVGAKPNNTMSFEQILKCCRCNVKHFYNVLLVLTEEEKEKAKKYSGIDVNTKDLIIELNQINTPEFKKFLNSIIFSGDGSKTHFIATMQLTDDIIEKAQAKMLRAQSSRRKQPEEKIEIINNADEFIKLLLEGRVDFLNYRFSVDLFQDENSKEKLGSLRLTEQNDFVLELDEKEKPKWLRLESFEKVSGLRKKLQEMKENTALVSASVSVPDNVDSETDLRPPPATTEEQTAIAATTAHVPAAQAAVIAEATSTTFTIDNKKIIISKTGNGLLVVTVNGERVLNPENFLTHIKNNFRGLVEQHKYFSMFPHPADKKIKAMLSELSIEDLLKLAEKNPSSMIYEAVLCELQTEKRSYSLLVRTERKDADAESSASDSGVGFTSTLQEKLDSLKKKANKKSYFALSKKNYKKDVFNLLKNKSAITRLYDDNKSVVLIPAAVLKEAQRALDKQKKALFLVDGNRFSLADSRKINAAQLKDLIQQGCRFFNGLTIEGDLDLSDLAKTGGNNLSGISFANVTFNDEVNFTGCNLVDAHFRGATFRNEVDFTAANISGVDFRDATFHQAMITGDNTVRHDRIHGAARINQATQLDVVQYNLGSDIKIKVDRSNDYGYFDRSRREVSSEDFVFGSATAIISIFVNNEQKYPLKLYEDIAVFYTRKKSWWKPGNKIKEAEKLFPIPKNKKLTDEIAIKRIEFLARHAQSDLNSVTRKAMEAVCSPPQPMRVSTSESSHLFIMPTSSEVLRNVGRIVGGDTAEQATQQPQPPVAAQQPPSSLVAPMPVVDNDSFMRSRSPEPEEESPKEKFKKEIFFPAIAKAVYLDAINAITPAILDQAKNHKLISSIPASHKLRDFSRVEWAKRSLSLVLIPAARAAQLQPEIIECMSAAAVVKQNRESPQEQIFAQKEEFIAKLIEKNLMDIALKEFEALREWRANEASLSSAEGRDFSSAVKKWVDNNTKTKKDRDTLVDILSDTKLPWLKMLCPDVLDYAIKAAEAGRAAEERESATMKIQGAERQRQAKLEVEQKRKAKERVAQEAAKTEKDRAAKEQTQRQKSQVFLSEIGDSLEPVFNYRIALTRINEPRIGEFGTSNPVIEEHVDRLNTEKGCAEARKWKLSDEKNQVKINCVADLKKILKEVSQNFEKNLRVCIDNPTFYLGIQLDLVASLIKKLESAQKNPHIAGGKDFANSINLALSSLHKLDFDLQQQLENMATAAKVSAAVSGSASATPMTPSVSSAVKPVAQQQSASAVATPQTPLQTSSSAATVGMFAFPLAKKTEVLNAEIMNIFSLIDKHAIFDKENNAFFAGLRKKLNEDSVVLLGLSDDEKNKIIKKLEAASFIDSRLKSLSDYFITLLKLPNDSASLIKGLNDFIEARNVLINNGRVLLNLAQPVFNIFDKSVMEEIEKKSALTSISEKSKSELSALIEKVNDLLKMLREVISAEGLDPDKLKDNLESIRKSINELLDDKSDNRLPSGYRKSTGSLAVLRENIDGLMERLKEIQPLPKTPGRVGFSERSPATTTTMVNPYSAFGAHSSKQPTPSPTPRSATTMRTPKNK